MDPRQSVSGIRFRSVFGILGLLYVLGWALPARADVVTRGCAGGKSCTANDVRIAAARAAGTPENCDPDKEVEFTLIADVVSTAVQRYDVGVFLNPDGGSAQTGQTCQVGDLPTPPADNADGDTCGDVSKANPLQGDDAVPIGTFTVKCEDTDGNGQLDVDSCLTWEQNKGGVCRGADDVSPGAPSKCRCERINITNIHVACNGQDCSGRGDACNEGFCNTATDQCETKPTNEGGSCNDNDKCTTNDVCTGGVCGGTEVVCTALDECHIPGICSPATGVCTNPTAEEGTGCDDGNFCTVDDRCTGGVCGGGPRDCSAAGDDCNGGRCSEVDRACVKGDPLPNGGTCDDNDLCTTDDKCTGGVCGGTEVICTASDECHLAGTCDSATGKCSDPEAPPNTPCSDDENICTNDVCTAGVCTHETTQPGEDEQQKVQSARAYGISLTLGGNDATPPGAPDTGTVTNGSESASLAQIDELDPLLKLHLMDETASANGGHTEAISETANVQLLNLASPPPLPLPLPPAPAAYLVEASAVKTRVACDATISGAACTDAGSQIVGLKILGISYGTVTPNNRPQPVNVNIPGVGKVTVAIFEVEEASGANAGIPQPQNQQNHANLKENAIRVKIELGGNEVIDLVVAHAEGSATTSPVCTESARVSGRGLVAGATLCTDDGQPCDQFVDDPSNQLVNELKGLVELPAGGGSEKTTVDVGPVPDATNSPSFTLVKADAGTSQTDGEVSGADAQSHTLTRTAQADIIDTHDGNSQSTPVIHLGVIETECNSTTANGGSSTGRTTIADAKIGGQDLCTALGLDPAPCGLGSACCNPPVNTDLCKDTPLQPLLQPICDGLGLKLLLNEQTGEPTGSTNDITVNGVHVIAKTPLGLNADAKVSSSHCDVASPAAE